jgi:hypothetical protein
LSRRFTTYREIHPRGWPHRAGHLGVAVIEKERLMDRRAGLLAGAAAFAAGVFALVASGAATPFVVPLLVLGGIVLSAAAIIAIRNDRARRKALTVTVAFVTAFSLGVVSMRYVDSSTGVAGGGNAVASSQQDPASASDALPRFEGSHVTTVGQGVPKKRDPILDSKSSSAVVDSIAEHAAVTTALVGNKATKLIAAAKDSGYINRSGLTSDFASAQAYQVGENTDAVVVPLTGTNAPDGTRVTYVYSGKTVSIVEMVSSIVDADNVAFTAWQDGVAKVDTVITKAASSTNKAGVTPVGLSWSRFKDCITNRAAVNWWILTGISLVCGVACAAVVLCANCLAAAIGWYGGTTAACVRYAWV